jgi:hypothetical protein
MELHHQAEAAVKIAAVIVRRRLTLSTARAQSPEGSAADDTARLLAGLPPSSNSPLAVLTKNPAWLSHARYFDQIFAKQSAHLSKAREFSKEYLTKKHDTMLYMFSGPDFLYATSFFPMPRRTFWLASNQWVSFRT